MGHIDWQETAELFYNSLRLKTLPLAVQFSIEPERFPAKTRRPSVDLGKRVTICQAVTMARVYGWTVGLTAADLICVPAMIAFGFSGVPQPPQTMARLFRDVSFSRDQASADQEVQNISFLANGEARSVLLAPLVKALFEPQTVVIHGNPAQIMRLIQAWTYVHGDKLASQFGGKVECTEYLIAPYQKKLPRIVIPGMGDRIFSMTQDDELVFAIGAEQMPALVEGLKMAGKKIGARYPVTFYQNFQPEFPPAYGDLAKQMGIRFDD